MHKLCSDILFTNEKYQSKAYLLPGTSYDEVQRVARKEHNKVIALTKRQPYARSAYFTKDKVFLGLFWEHIMQKTLRVVA